MRKVLPYLAAALLAAGCTHSDTTPVTTHTAAAGSARAALPVRNDVAFVRARLVHGERFAALADRGELVAYRSDLPSLRTKAYTWTPVALSEAHALNAIGGTMTLAAPDGHLIRLRYDHHVAHPDGNWTWVGRPTGAKPGVEAIITFGEKAVFGSIPDGSAIPLKLTTLGGKPYVVETSATAVAALPGATPSGPDAIPVPKRPRTRAADMPMRATSAPVTAEAVPINAATIVDVLLGYTGGFADRLGGDSQARTRLTNMTDIANQAYLNSNINARVRLVKTVRVNYPDSTDNDQALYDLTGWTCSPNCSHTGISPALQPMHDARAQYGADLVSLVRNFDDATNGSCGVGWILGGGQQPIDNTDAEFGMSVVSDSNGTGQGSFPSNGYICRDETLAHEFGHNMGSQHDRATAQGSNGTLDANEYGAYPYSFGYKTAAGSGNFYTVMAYGDSGQTRYRVFSNPDVTYCGGFACGVANQSDNARSLRQTMPVVSGFRASVVVFSDVPPDHWAYDYIKRLNVASITTGCADSSPWAPLYCPADPVLRDQMAVFLLRARYGGGYAPPAVATSRFSDVPSNQWAIAWIEKLAADQVTNGCATAPLRYCPNDVVSRAQMAVFILRTKYGASYVPPAATGVFQDVPTNYWAAAWIEKLSADGITSGCSSSPRRFCPDNAVSRDQMAAFLVRAFNL